MYKSLLIAIFIIIVSSADSRCEVKKSQVHLNGAKELVFNRPYSFLRLGKEKFKISGFSLKGLIKAKSRVHNHRLTIYFGQEFKQQIKKLKPLINHFRPVNLDEISCQMKDLNALIVYTDEEYGRVLMNCFLL